MKINTVSYLSTLGKLSKTCKHKISKDTLILGYTTMELTRVLDERMITLQRQGIISFAMSSRGEEACSVASAAALELEDWMFPQYREQGFLFWRGYAINQYIHHMFSNGKDITLGRQMPNHFGSRELNVATVSSPLGTQLPHAVGAAYAMKMNKEKAVSIAFFGDGTVSKGDFHTAMNFASVMKSPVIFFCRNNGYAISTPTSLQNSSESIAIKGVAYGVTSYQVDGNDFFAVHETVAKARKECLKGKGPILIEAMTYRLGAHSTSDDPSQYRDEAEVKKWEKRCPILRLRRYLESQKLWDAKKEKKLQNDLKKEIDEAIEEAKQTPPPPLETLISDVYFETPPSLQRQLEEVQILYP
ncbi:MAG: pyruvate dehydrogenase E1 component alpha subunit [Chlamydiales bacterium]|jgi:pyruvate dehydrogenase E1 component alpha subunit